jgi:hypothetical protein
MSEKNGRHSDHVQREPESRPRLPRRFDFSFTGMIDKEEKQKSLSSSAILIGGGQQQLRGRI